MPKARSLSADRPIESKVEDRLNRWPFARGVSQAIKAQKDPSSIVIAIYGAYGEGKTSVLNMIEAELQHESQFVTVRFNPWIFRDQTQLLEGFFATLADALGKSLKQWKEKIGDILTKYSFALAVKVYGVDASGVAKGLGHQLSAVEIEEQRNRLEQVLAEAGKRVVVIIDDIDRLDRNEIHSIFKLVKLSADFRLITYVLAFDDEMVSTALGERYSGGDKEAGRAFLEKIIQVPLHLPRADKLALRESIFKQIDAALEFNEISIRDDEARRFTTCFTDCLECRLQTPRMVSRYANAIAFALALLKDEVNVVDCLLLEGTRVLFPELYSKIRTEPNTFTGPESPYRADEWKKIAKASIERTIKGLDEDERGAALKLTKTLFPLTKSLFENVSYSEQLEDRLTKEQRVGSDQYLRRYLQYSVPPQDLPDRAIQHLVSSLDVRDVEQISAQVLDLVTPQRAATLVDKLRDREKSLLPQAATKLALAIAPLGGSFPHPEGAMFFEGPFSQAAILIFNLIKSIPGAQEREALAHQVAQRAMPVSFAVEIAQFLRKTQDQQESERVLAPETESSLFRAVADRVAGEAEKAPPYFHTAREASGLFSMWYFHGDKNALTAYLTRRFEEHPKEALAFLVCFLPTVWSGSTGNSRKGFLSKDTYDGIAKMIPPEKMINYFQKIFGSNLTELAPLSEEGKDFEKQAVAKFAEFYSKGT